MTQGEGRAGGGGQAGGGLGEQEVCVGGLGALTSPCRQGAKGLEAHCQLRFSWSNPLAGGYVEGTVNLHYKTDEAVTQDLELQAWCREITEVGL